MNTKIAEFVERLGCLNEDIWDEMRSQVKRFKNHQTPSYDKDKIDTLEKKLKSLQREIEDIFPHENTFIKINITAAYKMIETIRKEILNFNDIPLKI